MTLADVAVAGASLGWDGRAVPALVAAYVSDNVEALDADGLAHVVSSLAGVG